MASEIEIRGLLINVKELDLITSGRRTGLPRTVKLWFVHPFDPLYYPFLEDYVYLLASVAKNKLPPQWYQNLHADPSAKIVIKNVNPSAILRRALRRRKALPSGANLSVTMDPFDDPKAMESVVSGLFDLKYDFRSMNTRFGTHSIPVRLKIDWNSVS